MTLKDKMHDKMLESSWSNDNENECLEIWQAAEACAKIAEEDATRFAEWMIQEGWTTRQNYPGKWLKYGCVDNEGNMIIKTSQELYTLYQQEKK